MTKIHFAHSPDADDAFMHYALLNGKIDRGSIEPVDVREDIETLNRKALEGTYEVTAISLHAYPAIADKYFILTAGACFGESYGPVVVSRKVLKPKQLLKSHLGIPGRRTTAFMTLKLYEHDLAGEGKSGVCYTETAFDKIMDEVDAGRFDAGLVIHEGQLSYADKGLHKVVDLGEWWHKQTKLPLPLGMIAVRRDLDPQLIREIGLLVQKSVQYALDHREEALDYALPFARGLDREKADEFIGKYANALTVDMGRQGLKSIRVLLDRAYREGVLKQSIEIDDCVFDVKRGRVRSDVSGAAPGEEESQILAEIVLPEEQAASSSSIETN